MYHFEVFSFKQLIQFVFDKETPNIKFLLSFHQNAYVWEEAAQSFLTLCSLDFHVTVIKPAPSLSVLVLFAIHW